jgi:hypothetical protein
MDLLQPTEAGSRGGTDIFLLKYDYDGTAVEGWQYGGSNTEFMYDLQTDAFGGLYMAARATSSGGIALGPNLNATAGVFVARLMTVCGLCRGHQSIG